MVPAQGFDPSRLRLGHQGVQLDDDVVTIREGADLVVEMSDR
jgi:hypothetical protein